MSFDNQYNEHHAPAQSAPSGAGRSAPGKVSAVQRRYDRVSQTGSSTRRRSTFSSADDRELVRLLLRAAASEAREANEGIDRAAQDGDRTEQAVGFHAGCIGTSRHLEEAYEAMDPSGDEADADHRGLFADADLAVGHALQLLQHGEHHGFE